MKSNFVEILDYSLNKEKVLELKRRTGIRQILVLKKALVFAEYDIDAAEILLKTDMQKLTQFIIH